LRSHTSASYGGEERDGRRRLRRRLEQLDVVTDDEALFAHAFDLDRHEFSQLDELLPQRVPAGVRPVRLRRPEMVEDALAATARAEEPVCAIARQHLGAQLLAQGEVVRKDLGGKEPLRHVVIPVIAVAPGGSELARSRVRLEHRTDGVRGRAEPVLRRTGLALEVE